MDLVLDLLGISAYISRLFVYFTHMYTHTHAYKKTNKPAPQSVWAYSPAACKWQTPPESSVHVCATLLSTFENVCCGEFVLSRAPQIFELFFKQKQIHLHDGMCFGDLRTRFHHFSHLCFKGLCLACLCMYPYKCMLQILQISVYYA